MGTKTIVMVMDIREVQVSLVRFARMVSLVVQIPVRGLVGGGGGSPSLRRASPNRKIRGP